jgi:WD40 repeat protein
MTRRATRARLLAVAAVVALMAGTAACGGDDSTEETAPVTEAAPATTAGTEPETTTTEPPETTTVPEEAADEAELLWSVTHDEDDGLGNVTSVAVAPDGVTVVSGHFQVGRVHHLADGELVDVVIFDHTAADLAFSPDGTALAAGLAAGGVSVHDPSDGSELLRLGDGYDARVAVGPDGDTLATGDRDGIVWLWDPEDGSEVAALEATGTEWVSALELHPAGELLAITDSDCTLRVWDLDAGDVAHTAELDVGEGSCLMMSNVARFSPDGELLAGAVTEDSTQILRLWSVDGFEPVAEWEVPERVRDLDFSPDGSMLVVASREATTVWDVEDGTLLHTFDQEFDPVGEADWPIAVSFTPDGGHVAVGRFDGTLEVWRLPGAEELVAPEREACDPPPLPGDVLFDTASAELQPAADGVLAELAAELAVGFPDATLTFVGHTDSRGDAASNEQLSLERAEATRDWFADWAAENDADGWTLDVDGRGAAELLVPDTNLDGDFLPDAGELNRRVEIAIDDPDCAP